RSARQAGKKDLVTTSQKDITLDRKPGRESVMESATDKIEAKGYIVTHDFVALVVMHPKEEEASGEARRFFESFVLSDSAKTPEAEAGGQADSSPGLPPSIEVDKRPVPLNGPRTGYTEEARRHHVHGFVGVRALVDASGRVQDVRVITHLPYGLD